MFAKHLTNVFKPFPSVISQTNERDISDFLDTPLQIDLPVEKFRTQEI